MYIILILIVLVAAIMGPQWWAQYTFKRYAAPRADIPGNGAELARHLLRKLEMHDVRVEQTGDGNDHYDPRDKTVRLSPNNFNDRSLTAITVAAHEVGHAIQHHRNEPMLTLRSKLVGMANPVQKLGVGVLMLMPVIALVSRSPLLGLITLLAGMASMGFASVVHLVTLPVEIDASFNKALPLLFKGNYVGEQDRPAARRILKAAALTYVAASLASLLNLWRWLAILRR
jgi:Zn-dependent membrane protease YugP